MNYGNYVSAVMTLLIIPPLMSLLTSKLRGEMGRTEAIAKEHAAASSE